MSPLFKERPAPALRRPLTPAERPIFTSQALNPGKPLFNMALAVEVAAPLDPERLQDALRRVALGSDALRTVVRSEQGVPWAEVLEECDTTLEVEERPDAAWSDGSLRLELEDRARQHLPMDRPMTRVALFRGRTRSTLFVLQHHLITDALSLGVLLRRLGEAYAGPTRAGVSDPVETPQFMAYVQHLDGAPARDALHRASAFWKETTPQDTAPLRFYGRGADGEGRTHRARVALEGERARTLERLASLPEFRAFSREQSRFLVLSTVLSAWMARITDREEVAVGVPCHHRTATAFRETLGLFMELCPLRVQVQPDTSFRALAEQVRRATTETLRHAVPGAGALPEARGFGVVLNVITAELGPFAGHEVRADWIHAGAGDPAHPVRIQLHDFDGSGTPTMDFDLDESVFGPEERRWAVDHFLALLDALDADMDARVSEVRLVEWEDEASFATRGEDRFPPAGILSSFGAVLAERDHEVALVEGTTEVTFRELADRALELEGRLGEGANLAPGDVVGILMDRGTDLVTAMLAVMRTGAAYMTLDPAHPDERLAAQLRDAGASLVITTPERCDRVRPWGPAPVTLGSGESAGPGPERGPDTRETGGARADSALQPWPDPPPDRLAYVLYTSGSTGRPKGVEVSHGALAEYVAWAARTWDRGDRLTWAWFTSPAYDLTVTSIFTPLVSGGSIVVFPEDPDGGRLTVLDVFADPRVEVVKLTPSHLALLGSLDLSGSRVRRLVLGGENLPVALARAAHEAFGEEVEIYNEYGPTEATVGCMIHRFDPEMDTGDSVPIGVPADNVQIHVLSPAGTPTVRGESGEICIAGTRLARGYRGRPDLTEAAFVLDPLEPGARMYRTGDRGRWDASGTLEFLGRRDHQVKVGGIRLELGEVEAALARHPGIHGVAARVAEATRVDVDRRCRRCGLEGSHPEARIGEDGICAPCIRFERERDKVARYFGTLDDLRERLAEARSRSEGPQDVIMLYSGGKDSTYALCRIVEMGARPLVFMLDNGFISEQAKENARRVVDTLGLELVLGSTPAMPEIFAESLRRFSNVCQGCFKTIYNLALNEAVERGIGAIVTGLSRGQIFETRLADLYRRRIHEPEEVDRTIDEARRAYHRMDDAAARVLSGGPGGVDEMLDRVTFIDFYRYCDVELDELLAYIGERTPWIRPSDTGRSTNCLINEAGIYVHRAERRFHNYSLPYSWDVRLGHKERDAAVAELDDDIDPARIRQMLDQVGYRERPAPPPETRLVAYYTADEEVPLSELREVVARSLPPAVIPSAFIRLDTLPLGASGKISREALPLPGAERPSLGTPFLEPETPTQRLLAEIWAEVLGVDRVGIHDDFFELGGESMRCIQIAATARDRGIVFSPNDLFRNPTVAGLSRLATEGRGSVGLVSAEVGGDELDRLRQEFGA